MKDSNKTFLKGHTSRETAYSIPSYPYGRLRCEKLVWIETDKNGIKARLCEQTKNPKTNKWNNIKKSTYSDLLFLYIDHANNDYLKSCSFSFNYTSLEEVKEMHQFIINNEIQTTETEKAHFYYAFKSLSLSLYQWTYKGYTQETQRDYLKSLVRNIFIVKNNSDNKDFSLLFSDLEEVTAPNIEKNEQESYFHVSNSCIIGKNGIEPIAPPPPEKNKVTGLSTEEIQEVIREVNEEMKEKTFVIQPQEQEEEEKPFLNPEQPEDIDTEQLNIFEAPSQDPAPTPQDKFINDHFIISGFSPAQTEEIKTGIKERINN